MFVVSDRSWDDTSRRCDNLHSNLDWYSLYYLARLAVYQHSVYFGGNPAAGILVWCSVWLPLPKPGLLFGGEVTAMQFSDLFRCRFARFCSSSLHHRGCLAKFEKPFVRLPQMFWLLGNTIRNTFGSSVNFLVCLLSDQSSTLLKTASSLELKLPLTCRLVLVVS